MNKGGRPADTVWEHFLRVENNDNPRNKYAKCKHCGHVQLGKVERMKKHILSCQSQKMCNNSESVDCDSLNTEINKCETEKGSMMVQPKKRKFEYQQCLDSNIVKTSKNAAEKLNLLVAIFFLQIILLLQQ